MILQELLNLLERPSVDSPPKKGNFYDKFQKIDKIIQQEKNEKVQDENFEKAPNNSISVGREEESVKIPILMKSEEKSFSLLDEEGD